MPVRVEVQSFPDLPVDIARRILEKAATLRRVRALRLVHVSKAVHSWYCILIPAGLEIQPILYHTILIKSNATLNALLSTLRANPTLAGYIRALSITFYPFDTAAIGELLQSCTQLDDLAWWWTISEITPYVNSLTINSFAIQDPQLQDVHSDAAAPTLGPGPGLEGILPASITHLYLRFNFDCPLPQSTHFWETLFARCPALTHLMVYDFAMCHRTTAWRAKPMSDLELVHNVILGTAPDTFRALVLEFESIPRREGYLDWVGESFGPGIGDARDGRVLVVCPIPYYRGVRGIAVEPYRGRLLLTWADLEREGEDVWEFVDEQLKLKLKLLTVERRRGR